MSDVGCRRKNFDANPIAPDLDARFCLTNLINHTYEQIRNHVAI